MPGGDCWNMVNCVELCLCSVCMCVCCWPSKLICGYVRLLFVVMLIAQEVKDYRAVLCMGGGMWRCSRVMCISVWHSTDCGNRERLSIYPLIYLSIFFSWHKLKSGYLLARATTTETLKDDDVWKQLYASNIGSNFWWFDKHEWCYFRRH